MVAVVEALAEAEELAEAVPDWVQGPAWVLALAPALQPGAQGRLSSAYPIRRRRRRWWQVHWPLPSAGLYE